MLTFQECRLFNILPLRVGFKTAVRINFSERHKCLCAVNQDKPMLEIFLLIAAILKKMKIKKAGEGLS